MLFCINKIEVRGLCLRKFYEIFYNLKNFYLMFIEIFLYSYSKNLEGAKSVGGKQLPSLFQ